MLDNLNPSFMKYDSPGRRYKGDQIFKASALSIKQKRNTYLHTYMEYKITYKQKKGNYYKVLLGCCGLI